MNTTDSASLIHSTAQNFDTPRFEISAISDIGMKRSKNQDSMGCFIDENLFMVADGMGGHKGGEVASGIAIQTVLKHFRDDLAIKDTGEQRQSEKDPSSPDMLSRAVAKANTSILRRSQSEKELEGMGTTSTLLYFRDGRTYVGHVGDSRCYLIRPEGLWQLTRDHSLVQEKLRAGMITREQVKTDRMKNVITRSVGFDLNFSIDVYAYDSAPGDYFLLCSDGLTGFVDDAELFQAFREVVFTKKAPLQNLVEQLITTVNSRGGDDNTTVLIVKLKEHPQPRADAPVGVG